MMYKFSAADTSIIMNIDNSKIDSILKTSLEIIETAQNVNRLSHERKQITTESLLLLSELIEKNTTITKSYKQVFSSLQNYTIEITGNINAFKPNLDLFQKILSEINTIKDKLLQITSSIMELIEIVDVIKKDTDDINALATNASIVSCKYETAVFQILSDKFNNMAEFINKNLVSIIQLVNPIKDSIENLKNINSLVITDIESGYHNFLLFLEKLGHQELIVDKQIQKAQITGQQIEGQKDMLVDIHTQVYQMDYDASKAIEGSGNVKKIGESISESVNSILSGSSNGKTSDLFDFIIEQGSTINKTATVVNERSKSQLDFSYNSLEFCKSIINQSKELKDTVTIFKKQSIDNNQLAVKISSSIIDIITQLNRIEESILNSNETMTKFINDYMSISNILTILKAILKMMKILGIYSRIEASREPIEFSGFLTISRNIQKLQNRIAVTLPKIEGNIKDTKLIIDSVNKLYQDISNTFSNISNNSLSFTDRLKEISDISKDAEEFSKLIYDESLNLDLLLKDLENYLNKLTEVVKEPIEGSSQNIKRGKYIEEESKKIKEEI